MAFSLNVTEFCQADKDKSERLTISLKKEAKHFSLMERGIPWPTGSVLRFINAGEDNQQMTWVAGAETLRIGFTCWVCNSCVEADEKENQLKQKLEVAQVAG